MAEFTTKDVREFITKVLITGGILKVDDAGIVYWKGAEDEMAVVDLDGGKGILHTYTTSSKHPDAVIINPFSEAITMSIDRNWFYKVTSNIFAQNLIRVMRTLIVLAQEKEEGSYPDLLPYITPIADKIDDKVLTEFNYIVEVGTKDFCSIVYHARAKETKLFLGIEDPTGDFTKAIPTSKVRKKTWTLLQTLLKSIFKTEGPVSNDLVSSTCLMNCPHFRTYMDVWIRCWRAIEPIAALTDPINEELPELLDDIESHLERIDAYFKLCQWMGQTSATQAVKKSVKKMHVPGTKAEPGPLPCTSHQPEDQPGPIPGPSKWDSPKPGYGFGTQAPIQPSLNRWDNPPAQGSIWDSPPRMAPGTTQSFGYRDPNYQDTVFGRPYQDSRRFGQSSFGGGQFISRFPRR